MGKKYKIKEAITPYMFLLPLIIIMLVFLLVPIIRAAMMSFQYYYVIRPSADGNYFVGLENYKAVLTDKNFHNSVKVTIEYIFVTVIGRYVIGFIAALALNVAFKGRGLARALLIIPWAVPEVVACLVWILMYDRDWGIVNAILSNAGIISNNIAFLQDTSVVLPAAMAVNIWKGFPFVAIMLLAGMQSVSSDLYEAAEIDGATWLQKVRNITIPGIKSVSSIVFLLLIIWTIKDYAIAYVLAKGGPSRATEIMTIFVQQTAFKYFDFGKAAAAGMLMLLVSLVFTFFYFKAVNKGEED